jgi:hypothetical protein
MRTTKQEVVPPKDPAEKERGNELLPILHTLSSASLRSNPPESLVNEIPSIKLLHHREKDLEWLLEQIQQKRKNQNLKKYTL